MSSWSLANATSEPQKLIEPMIAANRAGISASSSMSPPERRYSTMLISATAPPPTPLKSATICGIAVMRTLRAAGTPTAVPSATPTTISGQSPTPRWDSVATTAIAMPTAAIWLPRTAVRGPRSMCRPTMKKLNATMYARLIASSRLTRGTSAEPPVPRFDWVGRRPAALERSGGSPPDLLELLRLRLRSEPLRIRLALEHAEHAVGHQEAADHVDRAERDRDHEQEVAEEALGGADQQQAAQHDDSVDRVRAAP